jgi:Sulfotransferase domain
MAVTIVILLAMLLPLAASYTKAPEIEKSKVFVIGLSKTGTTSLGDALSKLGYRRSGWEDLRSRWLYHAWFWGNLQALDSHTSRFDAFEDIPWAQTYRRFADIYPSAKFVLTERRDEETWLNSIEAHTVRRLWDGHREIYGCYEARNCRQSYLGAYRSHNDDAVRFFETRKESHRLLRFVIDGPLAGKASSEATAWNSSRASKVDEK